MPAVARRVVVDYFKWPDRGRRSYKGGAETLFVGEDHHGSWLWSPPAPRRPGADYDSFLTLVPGRDWWTATWIFQGLARNKIWVDITTPAEWPTAERVVVVDLEIDVQLLPGGMVEVLDEDEFAQRSVEWSYPEEVRAAAPDAASRIAQSLRAGTEPFFAVGDRWLDVARAAAG